MLPFFPEQSQGPVTSLPEQDNALPKWWKEILPRMEVNEVVVRTREEADRVDSLKWGGKMLVVRCSLAGAITHLKRDCETALVSVQYLFSHSSRSLLSLCWLPSASPRQTLHLAQKEERWLVWTQKPQQHWLSGHIADTEVTHGDLNTTGFRGESQVSYRCWEHRYIHVRETCV